MSRPLSGMVCLVTGATRGIGKGIALQLGEAGGTVYITGRTLNNAGGALGGSLQETAKEIEDRGGVCIPVQCDHSKDEDIKRLFDRINKEQDGRLDILVNNAYAAVNLLLRSLGTPFWELQPEVWDDVNNVGLRNHYVCTVHASRMMVPRKQGLIVNVSSPGGLKYLFNVAYGVGKCALDRMAADVAVETRKHNVTCVSLWPGTVRTETMTDSIDNYRLAQDVTLPGVGDGTGGFQMWKSMFMEMGETIEFAGRAVVHLATDKNRLRKSGRILLAADLSDELGFTDIDGSKPPNLRSLSTLLALEGWARLSKWIPSWIKLPGPLMWNAGNKF